MVCYYVDSCIWLNLFKNEKSYSGKDFGKIAKQFFDFSLRNNHEIVLSSFIIREMQFVLSEKDSKKVIDKIKHTTFFKKHFVSKNEFLFARFLEKEFNYSISFFDCVHLSICMKNNFVLVTRDNLLIKKSNGYAKKPEELLK